MRPIQVLPAEIVREIAAGEVITRPVDAVKELLENALDAGATRIELELERGGLALIRVTDDGLGIALDQISLAPKRFATSKLEAGYGLSSIDSLGFRGEALWSIAFAASLVLTSRPKDQLGGAKVIAFGEEAILERVACASGTNVEVRDLFQDYPARLASLESPALEARRVMVLLNRYVLHYPNIAWRAVIDGEIKLIHTPGNYREAVATVYGAMTANRMLEVNLVDGDYTVTGVVSRPEMARPRRDRMHISVNGRPIELDDQVAQAVLKAFQGLLPKNYAPICVLDISAPPQKLNVNTHPSKLRVGFLEPELIRDLLETAVLMALREHPLAKSAPEPRVVSGPIRAFGNSFPALLYIGSYRDSYLLAEGDGDLWLIDQHAAHERILYEELERAFDSGHRLELPEPELIQLTPLEVAHFEARAPELEAWGLTLEPFGASLYRVRALPAVVLGLPMHDLTREIVHEALGEHEAKRAVLSRLSCHPAIKAGHKLAFKAASDLLESLRACEIPWTCPHGRPTALRLTERDLAHQFGRRSARDVARVGDERSSFENQNLES
jgi:DNA mismatch repair protein MutL